MTAEEKILAKERAIECRGWGGSLKDCATVAGIDADTLRAWRNEDSAFSVNLELALLDFKKSLVKGVRAKRPEFILERRWLSEYGPPKNELPNVTNNVLIIGDDKLSELLYGFTKRLTDAKDTPTSSGNAIGGETTSSNGVSK